MQSEFLIKQKLSCNLAGGDIIRKKTNYLVCVVSALGYLDTDLIAKRADKRDIDRLNQLENFCKMSNLRVNFIKSLVMVFRNRERLVVEKRWE